MTKPKGLGLLVALWLPVLVNGCGEGTEKLKPDRLSVGITSRQIAGSYQGSKVNTMIPLWEVRAKKAAAKNLDAYARLQLNHGAVTAEHPVYEVKSEGDLESLGFGLNYFPFETRLLGLEAGVEGFRAGYKMRGHLGPIKQVTPDSFWGGGFNLGLVGEVPLTKNERWKLIWGAGHNFTATECGRAEVGLSGLYGTVNIEINWGQ
jgi:hypothetical protein